MISLVGHNNFAIGLMNSSPFNHLHPAESSVSNLREQHLPTERFHFYCVFFLMQGLCKDSALVIGLIATEGKTKAIGVLLLYPITRQTIVQNPSK